MAVSYARRPASRQADATSARKTEANSPNLTGQLRFLGSISCAASSQTSQSRYQGHRFAPPEFPRENASCFLMRYQAIVSIFLAKATRAIFDPFFALMRS